MKKVLVTGAAGFIGFHVAKQLLENGYLVSGIDALTDYYDVNLKKNRLGILAKNKNYFNHKVELEDYKTLDGITSDFKPDAIIHLAAQAGVRYSLENPRAYLNSNIQGSFNVLEAAKNCRCEHLMMASTSSVYGSNTQMPFSEKDKTDTPLTFYAATKKANEVMAHSYSHLWNMPITMFRFFTVYGPWGRPDLALFKFTKAMLNNQPIDIYNNGEMHRDFTYIDDLVNAILLLMNNIPSKENEKKMHDNIAAVAPFRIVNIGNSSKVKLMDFISEIEQKLNIKAKRNYMPLQTGDVPDTWANCELLESVTGFKPSVSVKQGISNFVDWYLEYYGKK